MRVTRLVNANWRMLPQVAVAKYIPYLSTMPRVPRQMLFLCLICCHPPYEKFFYLCTLCGLMAYGVGITFWRMFTNVLESVVILESNVKAADYLNEISVSFQVCRCLHRFLKMNVHCQKDCRKICLTVV